MSSSRVGRYYYIYFTCLPLQNLFTVSILGFHLLTECILNVHQCAQVFLLLKIWGEHKKLVGSKCKVQSMESTESTLATSTRTSSY